VLAALLSDPFIMLANPADPVRQIAQRALIRVVSGHDMSSQEVSHILMGYSLHRSSTAFQRIYLGFNREVVSEEGEAKVLKTNIDKYCGRPAQFEALSCAKFYAKHFFRGSEVGTLQKVAVVVPFGLKKVSEESPAFADYCFNYLMFHKPFRVIADLQGNYASIEEAFREFVKSEDEISGVDLESAMDTAERAEGAGNDDETERGDVDDGRYVDDYFRLFQLNPEFVNDRVKDYQHDWTLAFLENAALYETAGEFMKRVQTEALTAESVNIDVDPDQLNAEQRAVYDEVLAHLNSGDEKLPILKIISGTAGTGKSYLIHCLRRLLGSKCLLLAPTGMASCNVRGRTIHSAFKIPTKEDDYDVLKGDGLDQCQSGLSGVEYIIIDEMSVVGLRQFHKIDERLRQIFSSDNDKLFGGRSILLLGDFGQLAPPGDKPLFSKKVTGPVYTAGSFAYRSFKSACVLSTVIRQNQDMEFCNILQRVRSGDIDHGDYGVMQTRLGVVQTILQTLRTRVICLLRRTKFMSSI
ncbi:MAG: AAA family ATPase, partial [Pirellulales bacterium]